uniref:HTH CENPB-type domain-containing protein n=1 Tax=Bionectria ochroleuca TaxID=29856 RepID=A0A0B7KT03_BIOOC
MQKSDREMLIEEALKKRPDFASIRAVAEAYGLPESTLRGRMSGKQEIHEAKENNQKLSPEQERELKNWILSEECVGRAPTRREVRGFAQCIAAMGQDDVTIGAHWVERFLSRYPEVAKKLSRVNEAHRVTQVSKEAIQKTYELLDNCIKEHSVGMNRIFNVDQTGVAEGRTRHGKVIGTRLTRYSTVAQSDSTTWVSITECISAAGRIIKPLVTFTGTDVQQQWFPDNFPEWPYGCSKSGWVNSDIMLDWLEHIFLPETTPQDRSLWRILILDNLKSQLTAKFMYTAWLNRVQLIYLPANSTQVTQPLDVGVFGLLKTFFYQETRGFATFNTTAPVQKQRFIQVYKVARDKAFTFENI